MRPEIDVPLMVAANVAPYLSVMLTVVVRRTGITRRRSVLVGAAVLVYVLVLVLAPVGDVMRQREGWLFYGVAFVVLGLLTWVAIPLWWLTWLVWMGRVLRRLPRQSDRSRRRSAAGSVLSSATTGAAFITSGTVGAPGWMSRETAPTMVFTVAWIIAMLPWVWPLSSIPIVGPFVWMPAMASILGLTAVVAAIAVSDRRPRFLLPRDLRDEAYEPSTLDEWPFRYTLVLTTIVTCLSSAIVAVIAFTTHWSGTAVRALALPVLLATSLVVFIPAAGYRRRRADRASRLGPPM